MKRCREKWQWPHLANVLSWNLPGGTERKMIKRLSLSPRADLKPGSPQLRTEVLHDTDFCNVEHNASKHLDDK